MYEDFTDILKVNCQQCWHQNSIENMIHYIERYVGEMVAYGVLLMWLDDFPWVNKTMTWSLQISRSSPVFGFVIGITVTKIIGKCADCLHNIPTWSSLHAPVDELLSAKYKISTSWPWLNGKQLTWGRGWGKMNVLFFLRIVMVISDKTKTK